MPGRQRQPPSSDGFTGLWSSSSPSLWAGPGEVGMLAPQRPHPVLYGGSGWPKEARKANVLQ